KLFEQQSIYSNRNVYVESYSNNNQSIRIEIKCYSNRTSVFFNETFLLLFHTL
ncbi:hypothetical protein GIB67_027448, partial [Kingdonia uniflora]